MANLCGSAGQNERHNRCPVKHDRWYLYLGRHETRGTSCWLDLVEYSRSGSWSWNMLNAILRFAEILCRVPSVHGYFHRVESAWTKYGSPVRPQLYRANRPAYGSPTARPNFLEHIRLKSYQPNLRYYTQPRKHPACFLLSYILCHTISAEKKHSHETC